MHENIPFNPLEPAQGAQFFGRQDELEWIVRGVERSAKLLLYGAAGMGKSSLAREAASQVTNGKAASHAFGVDLSRYRTLDQLIAGFREAALPLMSSGSADAGRVAGDIANRVAGGVLPALDENSAAMGPVGILALLDRMNLHARTRGAPTLVVIEHYEQLGRFQAPALEEGLRGALAGHRSLSYLVTGEERAIKKLAAGAAAGLGNAPVETRRLGPLPAHAFAGWIDAQFASQSIVAPGVGSACVDQAGPRTRDIIELASRTFVMAASTRFANRVTVDQALEQSIAEKTPDFLSQWNRLSAPERAVVNVLAAGKGRTLLSADGYKKAGVKSDTELKEAVAGLEDKQIVESGNGLDVRFSSPLFRGWAMQARLTWNRGAGGPMVGETGPRFAFNFRVGREEKRGASVAI
jgi:hypothetical protein